MLYLDTSALLKLYLREPGAEAFRRAAGAYRPWLFTSRVAYAETLAGLARVLRESRISRRTYRRKRIQFESGWAALHVVELSSEVLAPAAGLIEKHGLRGFDAVHLCSALWLDGPDFACFDRRLRSAARAEGLTPVPR